MRSILIHADATPAMEARFQTGLDIARRTNGHVRLHVNTPLQRFVAMDPFGGAYVATAAVEQARANEDALIEEFSARLTREDVPWNIEASGTELADGLGESAALCDLVIVSLEGRDGAKGGSASPSPAANLAVTIRAPLLALPVDAGPVALDDTAVVAWNGSAQSARALRAAVPMLQWAERVVVATIGDSDSGIPATDALHYLSLHDVHAELVERPRGTGTIEETLDMLIAETGAAWIAMGAFGHGPLREALFGGVTRYFLDGSTVPLLLSH